MNQVALATNFLLAYESYPDVRHMYPLTDRDLANLAKIFLVNEKKISVAAHPLNDFKFLLRIEYPGRINVASAVASHLNRDPAFYEIPPGTDFTSLHHQQNKFAFVAPPGSGRTLCLTFSNKDSLIHKLQSRAADISYVIQNPDIMFLRPKLDFPAARSHLAAGYRVSL